MSQHIVPDALKWIKFAGLDVNAEKIHFRSIVLLALTIVMYVFEWQLIASNIGDIDVWVRVLEVFSPVFLSTLKVITLYFERKAFSKINRTIESLWPTSKFGPELGSAIESTFNRTRLVLFFYRWFAVITTSMIVPLKPIFSGGLPVDLWQPFNMFVSPYYELAYVWGTICSYYAAITNLAMDSLFIGYLTHMICQFRILQYALRNVLEDIKEEEKCMVNLKSYVEYHNQLLEYGILDAVFVKEN